jgi:glycosyltransferase involved in cell wall biosynthesis
MDEIRWFAPNRFCTLPVGGLQRAGFRIATEGDEPAALAFAADGVSAVEAWRYARRHRMPLVLYLWDLPPWQLGEGRPYPVVPLGDRLIKIPLPGGYPERSGYFSRQCYLAHKALDVWAPSVQSRDAVRRHFSVGVTEVPFCIDSERFHPLAGWQPPKGPATVLVISRLVPYKNHAAVIRAAALVDPRPQVRIIGRGPEAGPLRSLAAELGVKLWLDEERLSDWQILEAYLGAHVVVSASRFEGLGLTPLEGSALGMPVVASDIPPHREFADGNTRLVPLDDDAALAIGIESALWSARKGERVPAKAPVRVTLEACVARMSARFAEILR